MDKPEIFSAQLQWHEYDAASVLNIDREEFEEWCRDPRELPEEAIIEEKDIADIDGAFQQVADVARAQVTGNPTRKDIHNLDETLHRMFCETYLRPRLHALGRGDDVETATWHPMMHRAVRHLLAAERIGPAGRLPPGAAGAAAGVCASCGRSLQSDLARSSHRILFPLRRPFLARLCVDGRISELKKEEKCRHIRDYTVSTTHPDGGTFPVKNNSRKNKQNPFQQPPKYARESFDGGIMTSFGGAGLWRRFVDKLEVSQRFALIQFEWGRGKFTAAC